MIKRSLKYISPEFFKPVIISFPFTIHTSDQTELKANSSILFWLLRHRKLHHIFSLVNLILNYKRLRRFKDQPYRALIFFIPKHQGGAMAVVHFPQYWSLYGETNNICNISVDGLAKPPPILGCLWMISSRNFPQCYHLVNCNPQLLKWHYFIALSVNAVIVPNPSVAMAADVYKQQTMWFAKSDKESVHFSCNIFETFSEYQFGLPTLYLLNLLNVLCHIYLE